MIVSVSRRTDIPAFYATWFMNRVRAGYCTVPNPSYPEQVSVVGLRPADVTAFVFCTRNPRPLFRGLAELDARGYRYYFHQTLVGNPRAIDPYAPAAPAALRAFRELAGRLGPERVIWRYDPIVLSELTPPAWHLANFAAIATALRGHTRRCVVSILDPYRKIAPRLAALAGQGVHLLTRAEVPEGVLGPLLARLVELAGENGMDVVSCAEETGLEPYGVRHGKCMDDELIGRLWGLRVPATKNPAMRSACGCVVSRDAGMYDACLFGCAYCYATTSFSRARANHAAHDPASPSLLGWHDATPEALAAAWRHAGQLSLFG